MSDIYVFGPNDETNDYSSFGLVGALLPTEATFTEAGNGDSSVSLTCPLDEFGRYAALAKGNILLCPVPVRTTPEIQNGSCVTTVWTYKVKPLAQLTNKKQRTLYKKQKGSSRLKIMNAGDIVTVVLKPTSSTGSETRWKVKSQYGTGWIIPDGFELVTEKKIDNNANAIQEVQSPWTVQPQRFRIYEIEKTIDEVTVQARHISYDLLYNMTTYKSDESVTLQTALNGVLNNCINKDHGFTAYTNVANEQAGLSYNGKNPIDAMLDPEEGLCAKYKVNLIRDNDELFFLNDPGMNRGVKISYGKNMTGVSYTVSDDSVATRILPVGENKDGTPLYLSDTESERYIDSTRINDYPVVHVYQLDCDNCKVGQKDSNGSRVTVAVARARMKKQAEDLLTTGVDLPTIKMEVEYTNLGDTEEYAQFKNLENCFLYDYLIIQHGKQDINVTAQIQEIEWDILTDMMKSVTIGSVGETLANMGITTWQIPSGFSGSKIGYGTIGSGALASDVISTRHLQASSVNAEILEANSVNAMIVTAVQAKIHELVAGSITTDQLYVDLATIAAAQITTANIDKAEIKWADIESLSAEIAKIANAEIAKAEIDYAQIKNLDATVASIAKAQITQAVIKGAQIEDASITTAKIALGAITSALIQNGAIGTAQIADGSITDAKIVSLNADVITAGTLSVERLLIKGPNGLFRAINATDDGLTVEQLSEEQYQNAISGTVLVARSVTADKIAAKSITANEILGNTITAAEINVANLFAAEATITALDSYILKTSTIEAIEGKLDIWAADKIDIAVGGLRVGGRNYILGTAVPYVAESDGSERKWLFPWSCADVDSAKSLYGQTVTISFDYDKSISSGSFQILTNATWQGVVIFDAGEVTDQHFEKTFDINATSETVSETIIYIDGTWNGSVTFRNLKLEVGNKATDWTTAPEEVQIGNVISMDKTHTRISTQYFDVDVPGDAGDLHIDENGMSADTATFNTVNCDEIVKFYSGSTSITLSSGDDVSAISSAFCNRMITRDILISIDGDINGALILRGICGSGNITIRGNGNTLNGYIILSNNVCGVWIEGLNVSKTSNNRQCVSIDRCADVKLYGGIFNANNLPSNAQGVRVTYSGVFIHNCEFYNIPDTAIALSYGADALVLGCKGVANYCFWYDGATLRVAGSRPSGICAGGNPSFLLPSDPSTIAIDTGSAKPAETPVTTTSFTANVTGTYYPSGHWINDNIIRQGHEGSGSNGRRDYGCMWFDAGSMSGKTIKSATLTIKRMAGKGRSSSVAMKLWTTALTGKSGKPTDSLVSVGDIGKIANGETLTVNIPTSSLSAIASGGGFVLYTEETTNKTGKTYSENYAHFEGTDGNAPVLTVTYQ